MFNFLFFTGQFHRAFAKIENGLHGSVSCKCYLNHFCCCLWLLFLHSLMHLDSIKLWLETRGRKRSFLVWQESEKNEVKQISLFPFASFRHRITKIKHNPCITTTYTTCVDESLGGSWVLANARSLQEWNWTSPAPLFSSRWKSDCRTRWQDMGWSWILLLHSN